MTGTAPAPLYWSILRALGARDPDSNSGSPIPKPIQVKRFGRFGTSACSGSNRPRGTGGLDLLRVWSRPAGPMVEVNVGVGLRAIFLADVGVTTGAVSPYCSR